MALSFTLGPIGRSGQIRFVVLLTAMVRLLTIGTIIRGNYRLTVARSIVSTGRIRLIDRLGASASMELFGR